MLATVIDVAHLGDPAKIAEIRILGSKVFSESTLLGLLEQTGFRVISATPRGAIHSDHTSLPVKLSFGFGTALWHTLGVFLAPGAVVIAEKP